MGETPNISALKERLAEAEDTLRAIRFGEVDALLVQSADSDRVIHVGDWSESYHGFMEAMDTGAAALDGARNLLYANQALTALVGVTNEELQRTGLLAALGASMGQAAAETVSALLDNARVERRSAQISMGAGAARRHVMVNAAPLQVNFAPGFALTFTDITQRIDAAAAEERERIGGAIMASTTEAVVVCDLRGVVTHASPAVADLVGVSPVGRRFEDAFALSFTPGAGPLLADDLVAIALSGTPVRGLEASLPQEEGGLDLLVTAAPLRQAGGRVGGCIVTLVDLTARKALEKRQALLLRELDHRMKNMLALVLSISTRTLASVTELGDFRERFTQRIAALAATQNLLSDRAWVSAPVAEIIQVELAPFLPPRSPRVALGGLAVEVTRDAAVSLGLVFHELVTNAVKYGALSNESGRITVTGTRRDGMVEITWREEGGPAVLAPGRAGFGQTLIARGLGHVAAEPTQVDFAADGLVCRMVLAAGALA